jgi:hypothetical protein
VSKFKPGDDVIVELKGRDHQGEVIEQRGGYVMCRVHIDPVWDYGSTSWVDPEQTVCRPESSVRHKGDTPE